jgi:hypothetical protein
MRLFTGVSLVLAAGTVFGQSYQRQATISGNGSLDQGQCVVEVQVDASAEVEIRGTNGVLRNLAGAAPQWRQFECSGPMPLNPNNFRYTATGGRGQQQLVRDPSSTGVAIVRITDNSGGAGIYTFSFEWQGYAGNPGPYSSNGPAGSAGNPSIFDGVTNNNSRDRIGSTGTTLSSSEAVETCQQEIMRQAMQRFNTNNIYFRRTTIDNNRGAQNQVRGTIDLNANNNTSQRYRFNCTVNLNNGRIRSAQIDNAPAGQNTRDYGYKGGNYEAMGPTNANRVIQACETAVDRRLSEQGLQRVGFGSVDIDDRTGANRVFGSATVNGRNQSTQTVDFACGVNLQSGTASSVDVIPRR